MIKNITMIILLAVSPYCWSAVVTDTSQLSTQSSLTPATGSTNCTYFASDTYGGTEARPTEGGAVVTDVSNNFNLDWTNGTSSSLTTPVTCSGTYQLFFTVQIQSASNNNAINIGVCVKTNDDVTVYGTCPASHTDQSSQFTFNPQCNGGDYCPVRTFTFSKNVHLDAGQYITPPQLNTSEQTSLTGGEFLVLYVGP